MFDQFKSANLAHRQHVQADSNALETVISREDYARSRAEITQWDGYKPTPLVALNGLSSKLGLAEINYKHEGPRFGLGSFKALGGAYAALRVLQRELSKRLGSDIALEDIRKGKFRDECAKITLVSATDGNHGRALAWGAQRFGAPCRIYIHAEVSEGRAEAMRNLGAIVVRCDGDYDASVLQTKSEADANGWFVVSDTSWEGYRDCPRDVMSGYGVMVREIFDTLEQPPTHVFLQSGVGGLAAGVTASLCQICDPERPRLIVVETELAPCLFESSRAKKACYYEISEETIMAGLSCGETSEIAWEILDQVASDFMTIPDSIVAPTVRLLANSETGDAKIEAGESAVAGLAALISSALQPAHRTALGLDENARILLIGSEGVTDQAIFDSIMAGADHV